MVFECPMYDSIRFQFAGLFSFSSPHCQTLESFLSQNQDDVAQFIYACFAQRRLATQMSLAGSKNASNL